jgi:uncharacterized protein (DUF433 family)
MQFPRPCTIFFFIANFVYMNVKDVITVDPEVQFGTPVFAGTRVPVAGLFLHLEKGISIDEFLTDFPSVTRAQCYAAIELAGKLFSSKNFIRLYENAA